MMFNRIKRRSILITFFSIQFILFSTYLFKHYQTDDDDSDDINGNKSDPSTLPFKPERLPAGIIEKSNRDLINQNYKKSIRDKQQLQTIQDLKLLNISLVKDVDQQQTIIKCSILPTELTGHTEADLFSYDMSEIEEHYANSSIQIGGHWSPSQCTSRYRVAIIIPYRNRDIQLRVFINYMHTFLQKQKLDYQIFVIEPIINVTFNRALLFNIGFREAMKHYSWECFIFHDVDLIPEDDRNIYSCPPEPRHMSVAVNTMNYELPYRTIFGGVSALTVEQFKSVNGFSNQYFGWGGEDDDMAARILRKYRISRYPATIARYKMLRHRPDTPNQSRFKTLGLSSAMRSIDGLSNLNYTLIKIDQAKLFTLIQVTYNETLIKSSVEHLNKKTVPHARKKKTK